jgi:large subunit ribosomal protein L3
MILDVFATKLGMTQAWTKAGKRLAVTRVSADTINVIGKLDTIIVDKINRTNKTLPCSILEIAYGKKKLKNMSKPLRTKMEKSGFSFGAKKISGIRLVDEKMRPIISDEFKAGDQIPVNKVLEIGDIVKVQGITKGKGFSGAMKRHGFSGGPATHGQSDRARAVGSIGAGTTPGRVWLGKKMPGVYGAEYETVLGLVVVYIDDKNQEIWLSGPVPGSKMSDIKITKTGKKKNLELDYKASNIVSEEKSQVSKEELSEVEGKELGEVENDESSEVEDNNLEEKVVEESVETKKVEEEK